MKKLMVAVLVLVALSGCAANSRYQMAQDIGATVAGGVAGNYVDRKMGGKGTLGGVVGAVVAHQVYAGSQEVKASRQSVWWECKPGFGQVMEKQANGKLIPACKEGVPQTPRPTQQVAQQQQLDPLTAQSYYRGRQRAYDRQRRETARAANAQGCWDGGGC